MVNVALATALVVMPVWMAMALSVVVAVRLNAAL